MFDVFDLNFMKNFFYSCDSDAFISCDDKHHGASLLKCWVFTTTQNYAGADFVWLKIAVDVAVDFTVVVTIIVIIITMAAIFVICGIFVANEGERERDRHRKRILWWKRVRAIATRNALTLPTPSNGKMIEAIICRMTFISILSFLCQSLWMVCKWQ